MGLEQIVVYYEQMQASKPAELQNAVLVEKGNEKNKTSDRAMNITALIESLNKEFVNKNWMDVHQRVQKQIEDQQGVVLRLIRPNHVYTMEYNTNRVNVALDQAGMIIKFYVG